MSDHQDNLVNSGQSAHHIDSQLRGSLATNLEIEASTISAEKAGNVPVVKSKANTSKVQGIDRNNQPKVVPGEMLEDAKFTQT